MKGIPFDIPLYLIDHFPSFFVQSIFTILRRLVFVFIVQEVGKDQCEKDDGMLRSLPGYLHYFPPELLQFLA